MYNKHHNDDNTLQNDNLKKLKCDEGVCLKKQFPVKKNKLKPQNGGIV